MMKKLCRMILLLLCVLPMGINDVLAEGEPEANPFLAEIVYGQSELGRDLICYRAGQPSAEASILIVFGVHGYEDAFDRDDEVLKMIAGIDAWIAYCQGQKP